MSFGQARAIADAVLFEGYVLYPYRSTSTKNRYRWIFGVLAPREWSEADGGCEPWFFESQCLVEPTDHTRLHFAVRFLQVQRRQVERSDDGGATFHPVDSLDLDGTLHVSWEEGEHRECEFRDSPLKQAIQRDLVLPFEEACGSGVEFLRDARGVVRGRIVRECGSVRGRLVVRAEQVRTERPLWRLRLRVENVGDVHPEATRDEAIHCSCVAAHLLAGVEGGRFVSVLDPVTWARDAAQSCRQTRAWPVLVGDRERRDLVLASPIILADYPQVAPESPGDFFDAAEIDELLALRTANLTDEEKRQVRATDARAAEILDRVASLPAELLERLHGALRDLQDAEMVPRPQRRRITPGMRVRLKPGSRRTDAQDLLYAGRIAIVEKIENDVDGQEFLAVTLEGDPSADVLREYGRFHYYTPDEVEVVDAAEEEARP